MYIPTSCRCTEWLEAPLFPLLVAAAVPVEVEAAGLPLSSCFYLVRKHLAATEAAAQEKPLPSGDQQVLC